VGDNFSQFAKTLIPSPGNAFAFAASPLLAAGAACAIAGLAAVANGNPDAIASAYFGINNPDSSMLLTALKGQLPYEATNKAYQLFASGLGTGLVASGLAKVAQKFKSLSEETEHLKRENEMLKKSFANEHAVPSGEPQAGDTLKNRFARGFENVSSRTEQRQEHEQATRISSGTTLR
jgi:hypothetical protein